MSKIFNLNNTLTIHTQPDADAIFGNWCRMLTLAVKDPEGCVRPHPDQPMDAKAFAQYYHRPLSSVQKTITLLEQAAPDQNDRTVPSVGNPSGGTAAIFW